MKQENTTLKQDALEAKQDFDFLIENEEDEIIDGKKVRSKGIYILPNLFTAASLCCGFYAVICASNSNFVVAAISIFIAMVFDGCDGRVARLTNTQSAFGEQFDSLADVISFGLAPGFLAYRWALMELGDLGMMIAFIYASCAAIRLARFNVQIGVVDKNYFVGLASPAAAALVASVVWVFADTGNVKSLGAFYNISIVLFAFITFLSGILMVTNIKYSSFKSINFRKKMPLAVLICLMMAVALFLSAPSNVLLFIFFAYAISGVVLYFFKDLPNKLFNK